MTDATMRSNPSDLQTAKIIASASTMPGRTHFWSFARADARWLANMRLPIRNMLFTAMFVLSASVVVQADEHIREWIPGVLNFPDDAEVMMDSAIGSSVRLFSIVTGADVDMMLAEWEQNLSSHGYPVTQAADELVERSIEFSGPGILNAKIIVVPTSKKGQNLIQFDATLN